MTVQPVRGPGRWLRSYVVMLRWELTGLRLVIPVTAAVQILAGAGFALGIGLLHEVPRLDAQYMAAGTAVVTLVLVGLTIGPQLIAQQRMDGTYEYLWSMPIPRTCAVAAWATMTFLLGLPGMIAAVAVAAWRYDLSFHIGWSIVPAVLLTATTGTFIGYAIAHAVPEPMMTVAATQVLIFVLIGFSPVNFPAERLPGWLAELNEWLPFGSMATVVRGALIPELAVGVARSYAVLVAWAAVTMAASAAVLGRRG